MKKGNIILIIALVLVISWLVIANRKKASSINTETEPEVNIDEFIKESSIPSSENQQSLLPSDSKVVIDLARKIYNNKAERNAVFNDYGIGETSGLGLPNSGAIQQVLSLSGIKSIPVAPDFIAANYNSEILAFLEARGFEDIARSNFNQAESTYKNLMNFQSINLDLFDNLQNVVKANGFGRKSNADKNRSEDTDEAINNFKELFAIVYNYNKQSKDALIESAISKLRGRGYKFEGYDVIN